MQLCDDDKQLIARVDEQVKLLLNKGSSESAMLNTLIDYVPHIQCILNSSDETELKLYIEEYHNFSYFIMILSSIDELT